MASSSTSERSPLLNGSPSPTDASKKSSRNVTFNPNPMVRILDGSTSSQSVLQPGATLSLNSTNANNAGAGPLSSLNSKLRRRNSYGAPQLPLGGANSASKIGPQRTTKNVQKLKLLPNPEFGLDGPDEESGREVYSQYTRIKDPTARRDAARLGKADRDRLPRVTAYCTASKYQMDLLMRFLKGRGKTKGASPKLFDECIYTPYNYDRNPHAMRSHEVHSYPVSMRDRRHSDSAIEVEDNKQQRREDLIDLHTSSGDTAISNGDQDLPEAVIERRLEDEVPLDPATVPDFDMEIHTPEVFLFSYGVVVIWGMTLAHEERFLKEIARFESEKLDPDNVETEYFNFYYTREYQARIYNDFITLREKNNYMTKLAISHALAQSVQTSLFEQLVDATIETCKDIPTSIANTGTIALTRKEINMQIGDLFILRINIHLNGSVLDTPEVFWTEPQLEPIYAAVRSYLEIDQRVSLLSERLNVIADLLAVLKDQLSHRHGEKLEWVVIVLIAVEILVAVLNIVVDLSAGD